MSTSVKKQPQPGASFGELLRAARLRAGMSITELATVAGVPRVSVSRWECGIVKSPDLESIRKMASALKIPVANLI
jgi:transcriptional regulator with XRE-family HTH domain